MSCESFSAAEVSRFLMKLLAYIYLKNFATWIYKHWTEWRINLSLSLSPSLCLLSNQACGSSRQVTLTQKQSSCQIKLKKEEVPGLTGLTATYHTGWEEPVQTGHKQIKSKQVSNCVLNDLLYLTSKWNHHRFSSKTNNYFYVKLNCCRFIRGNDALI